MGGGTHRRRAGPCQSGSRRSIADEYRAVGLIPTFLQDRAQQEVGQTPVYTRTGPWYCRARILESFSDASIAGPVATAKA
jgi:hypothetical protein